MKNFIWTTTTVLWRGVAPHDVVRARVVRCAGLPGKSQGAGACAFHRRDTGLVSARRHPALGLQAQFAGWFFLLPFYRISSIVVLDQM
jgi:hypothetical protein